MVKQVWLCIFLPLLVSDCFAHGVCTTATEYQPVLCRVKLPKISAIVIEENGARSSVDDQKFDCSRFKLTIKHVRQYLTKAWQVKNSDDANHMLDWLPCYASGTLLFVDGSKAKWSITQSQTGSLNSEGMNGLILYCPDCKFKPFLW